MTVYSLITSFTKWNT